MQSYFGRNIFHGNGMKSLIWNKTLKFLHSFFIFHNMYSPKGFFFFQKHSFYCYYLFSLRGSEMNRHRQHAHHVVYFLNVAISGLGLSRAEAQNSRWISHLYGRNLIIGAITCCFQCVRQREARTWSRASTQTYVFQLENQHYSCRPNACPIHELSEGLSSLSVYTHVSTHMKTCTYMFTDV